MDHPQPCPSPSHHLASARAHFPILHPVSLFLRSRLFPISHPRPLGLHFRFGFAIGFGFGVLTALSLSLSSLHSQPNTHHQPIHPAPSSPPPPPVRSSHLSRLRHSPPFDVLVIGGGATGCGIALDCATRGLSVSLIERDDFASGTSSRSTKLIHGGVRYLEKAITHLDLEQFHLVRDALRERRHLLSIAPHLSRPLPILVPLYHPFPNILFWAPYTYFGTKLYDIIAGSDGILEPSYWISAKEAKDKFPMIKHSHLKGGVVYFDGQHNDSRMCLGIAMTAAEKGAVIANHVECVEVLKENGRVVGAKVRDTLDGSEWEVRAKVVINATGPFCDSVRKMANASHSPIISPSSGVHIMVSNRYSPEGMGLIIPKTADGRVLFLLPWEGSTIVGTTDSPTEISTRPQPHENEVQWVLQEASRYLGHDIKREDVDAAWSGIRPLAKAKVSDSLSTASVSRDHVIELTAEGMITITGGKWTTYRKMAEDAVDKLIECNKKIPKGSAYHIDDSRLKDCCTIGVPLIGASEWSLQSPAALSRMGFSVDVANHLSHNYGDRAFEVARIAVSENLSVPLSVGYPFLEAEIIYGCRNEMAVSAIDVIGNRMRLSYLNSESARLSLVRVIELMGNELNWDSNRRIDEFDSAARFIQTMNVNGSQNSHQHSALSERREEGEVRSRYRSLFRTKDSDFVYDRLMEAFNREVNGGFVGRNEIESLIAECFKSNSQSILNGALNQLNFKESDSDVKRVGWEELIFAVATQIVKLKENERRIR